MHPVPTHQFTLLVSDDLSVQGEYQGTPTRGAVLLVHGFGVDRNSRGMFSQLGETLQDSFVVVRFDLTTKSESAGVNQAHPLRQQAQMLQKVLDFVRSELEIPVIHIVAHSQGGLVVSLLAPPDVEKIILVATPTIAGYTRSLRRFHARPGSVIDESGISRLARSDGSFTVVNAAFWHDLKTIKPLELFRSIAQHSRVWYVAARQDEVLVGEDQSQVKAIPGLTYLELEADHNFTGMARLPWIKMIEAILSS